MAERELGRSAGGGAVRPAGVAGPFLEKLEELVDRSQGKIRGGAAGRVPAAALAAADRGPPEQAAALTEINSWFAERGFRVVPSAIDYAGTVRSSPWGTRAPSRDHHAWVDLAKPDGTVISPGYGSGLTFADAAFRARDRWQEEQDGGGREPGPRALP